MSDSMLIVAKLAPTAFTKNEWYEEINKRAELQRKPGESRETSVVRYAASDPDGRVLMSAYQAAEALRWRAKEAGDHSDRVEKTRVPVSLVRLQSLAADLHNANPALSRHQAMAKILNTPEGRTLYATEREERLAKCMPYVRI